MRAAHIAQITTPRGYLLNGLWFGIRKPHTVYIWIHGLTGTVFSGQRIIEQLARGGTAGLTFGNRGQTHVSEVKRRKGDKTIYETAGTAFEKFTDCVDDIQGAVELARTTGAKNVYLLGHSTGCQKAIYWAAKGGRGVRGIVLLGPLSDYADTLVPSKSKNYAAGVAHAKMLVRAGKQNELMPKKYTDWMFLTAQRFLSLYTPESVEEIFTYAQPNTSPRLLRKVRTPILAVLAEKDEFADRPASTLYDWFLRHIYEGEVRVIAGADHGFTGAEKTVGGVIREWSARTS